MARRNSGQALSPKAKTTLRFPQSALGHSSPRRCPTQCPQVGDALGEPLDLRQVARLIGCSPWTVRQKLISTMGLPVFRSGAGGKLIFYKDQVVRWIASQQGGKA